MKIKVTKVMPKGGEMRPTVLSPQYRKSKMDPGKNIIKVCTSADELTWQNIRNLSINLEMNKLELIANLIETTYGSDAYRMELGKFYTDFWLRREEPFSGPVTQNRINLPVGHLEMVRQMGWAITGTRNRSEFLRLLVAFWAWKRGLLKFTK
ncbi:MAG: hypothetical protein ACP5EP_11675 [Acidobacteriaceae bacterium]